MWECQGEAYAAPAAYCCESAAEKTRCCRTASAVFSLPGASVGNALAVQTFPVEGAGSSTVAETGKGTTVRTTVAGTTTGTTTGLTASGGSVTTESTRTGGTAETPSGTGKDRHHSCSAGYA